MDAPGASKQVTMQDMKCTKSQCLDDGDTNKLECSLCKRSVHYACTGLPVYQIHHFVHTKSYRKFVCELCTQVADHLKQFHPIHLPRDFNQEVDDLNQKIKEKQVEVDTLSETNRLLISKVKELTQNINKANKCYNDERKKTSTLQAEAEIMKTGIVTYEEKIAEFQMKEAKEKTKENASTNISLFIERKLKEVEANLKESILSEVNKSSKILDEKMNTVMDSVNSYANVVNRNASTAPSVSQFPFTPSSELRSVIREERNEQLTEIAEQKQRASNFVVHGVPESADFKVKDRISIIRLLETIGVEPNYVSIDRLGKKNENPGNSKRPIKVVMRSAKDKDLVMANLIKLKGNYTFNQRHQYY